MKTIHLNLFPGQFGAFKVQARCAINGQSRNMFGLDAQFGFEELRTKLIEAGVEEHVAVAAVGNLREGRISCIPLTDEQAVYMELVDFYDGD